MEERDIREDRSKTRQRGSGSVIHRIAVVLLEVVLALVVGVVLVGAVLAWRLSDGPIVLDVLKPYVETMLSPPNAGFRTEVGVTQVSWSGWNRALDVVAADVSMIEPDGSIRARVDSISVALSPKALLAGRLAPKRINVIDPKVTVLRTADGGWRLLPETDGPATEFDLSGLLQAFSGTTPGSPLSELLEIDVSGARIRLVDDQRGASVAAHGVVAALLRTRDGLAFHGEATVAWDTGVRTPVEWHGAYRNASGRVDVEARLNGMPVDALVSLHPALERLQGISIPVSGAVRISTGITGVGLSGSAELEFGPGRVAIPGLIDRPVDLARGTATITASANLEQVKLDGTLDLGGPKVALAATALRAGSGYGVTLDAVAESMPVNDLERYWPEVVAPPAREWVTENLRDGVVPRATAHAEAWLDPMDVGTLRLDTIGGKIDFTGVTTHYFRPLPPVTAVEGTAVYDADSFDITITAGRLDRLTLDRSRVLIRGLVVEVEYADIDVAVRGPLSDALRVIDHQPLGYPKKLGIKPDDVSGLAGARLRFDFLLRKDLTIEQVKLAAAANLTDVHLPGVVAGHDLNDAELTLDLNGAGMKLSGTGTVLGAPAEVALDQRFHRRGSYTSRSRIKTVATRERLAAFGLDLGEAIDGTMDVTAESEVRPNGVETVRFTADLQNTALQFPDIRWEKPAGASGMVRGRMTVRDGTPVSVDEFDLKAGDMAVQAVATLAPGARLKVIDVARLRLGRTDAAGRVERLDSGEWRLALRGPMIDLSPVLDADDDAADPSKTADEAPSNRLALDLRVAADTLVLTKTATFTRATLAVRSTGERLESLDLRGRVGEGYAALTVQPIDGQRRLTLRAEDAGEFLRALDIVDTVRGGRLGVDGRLTGDGLEDGLLMTARIEEFHVVQAPVLASVLSVASFTGLADLLRGDGIRFARMRVDLTMTPERIEARNGVAYGPGLGIKAEGAYDRTSELTDFVGLIAPAYSLSRLIDKIPVFGELLTGGEGEGLLATEFRVRGKLENPKVSVNPLTALAPGFLRDLLSTAERPADAPVVEPPSTEQVDPLKREDRGR